ncbi:MAG TPA: TetR/AcrR family transcriptional regulator [Desulfitobacteriaceae bacterium]|nr:TetR/AcrR family transcriptional regulator [Desulfitobacteriaceae bacterium]
MEKFYNLPIEKQNNIIDASLKSFGTNGYKKTSISDIANAAGISKAMIFHYFGTKKALYLYLINYCCSIMMKEVDEHFDNTVTDFFDRIMLSTKTEISVMKKHPAIPLFLKSIYFENDQAVKADIKAILTMGEDFRNKIAFEGMDSSKFKDNVDPKLVLKMLTLLADGFTRQISNIDFDSLLKEFAEYMNLLKNNLYKEEYLK